MIEREKHEKIKSAKIFNLKFSALKSDKRSFKFFLRLKTRFFFRKFLAGFRDLHFGVRFKNNRYSA